MASEIAGIILRMSSAPITCVWIPTRASAATFASRKEICLEFSATIRPPVMAISKFAPSSFSRPCQSAIDSCCSGKVRSCKLPSPTALLPKSQDKSCKCKLPALPPEASPFTCPRSKQITDAPARAAKSAAEMPVTPAPITTRSADLSARGRSSCRPGRIAGALSL